ncbi:LOG family protein [Puniceicoccaceae bacterium K14]|nr:LOG family protein [Puniceicoccaceae bacterium K14]
MTPDQFWISEDGRITSIRELETPDHYELTVTFKLRDAAEIELAKSIRPHLQFSERSTLARVGIEILAPKPPRINKDRLILTCKSFVYDRSFPCMRFFKDLIKIGTAAGRLFYAPESQKLTATEVWDAHEKNKIKLPNTTSIDKSGLVYLTPHKVKYTMPQTMGKKEHENVIQGFFPRAYLDKAQVREDIDVVSIPPKAGLLSSCSLYLKEHYVVLNRGEGNFGLHSAAVLLDPIKTCGSNIVLEIYNSSEEIVINPLVSIEVYHAPKLSSTDKESTKKKNQVFFEKLDVAYEALDKRPDIHHARIRPTTEISVSGQSARTPNQSILIESGNDIQTEIEKITDHGHFGYRTLNQAIRKGNDKADTLVIDHFPSLTEHIEILAHIRKLNIRQLVFRKAATFQDFFLSSDSHSRLETYEQLGLKVYWYNPLLNGLYRHVYKNNHGFFIKEELVAQFMGCTILAFYGSSLEMSQEQEDSITKLVTRMSSFFGPNVGILTGGGDGVMGLATDVARNNKCMTGAAFLELEAQPPKVGVDFFNTFQEQGRHNRQKWFQVADFCIFNMGGVGTLEEIGIELCNLKLGIRPRSPFVFFHDTYWSSLDDQLQKMIDGQRMPKWMEDYILFSGDPDEIIAFYKKTLQIL